MKYIVKAIKIEIVLGWRWEKGAVDPIRRRLIRCAARAWPRGLSGGVAVGRGCDVVIMALTAGGSFLVTLSFPLEKSVS